MFTRLKWLRQWLVAGKMVDSLAGSGELCATLALEDSDIVGVAAG